MAKLSGRSRQARSQFFGVDGTLQDLSLFYGIHHAIN